VPAGCRNALLNMVSARISAEFQGGLIRSAAPLWASRIRLGGRRGNGGKEVLYLRERVSWHTAGAVLLECV
jgi:hypothetical protein